MGRIPRTSISSLKTSGACSIIKTCILFGLYLLLFLVPASSYGEGANPATGQELFLKNCANCHGQQGEGFARLYPPLSQTQFLDRKIAQLPCIIRHGLKGEISVGKQTFNQIMPGNKRLTNRELAEIISYMQTKWGRAKPKLEIDTWLNGCDEK